MPASLEERIGHSSFPQPDGHDLKVWRYMSLAKLVSLLDSESLYLSRIDGFDDPYEGSLPVGTVAARTASMRSQGLDGPETQAMLQGATKLFRSMFYVNCWNLSEYESEALWKLYGAAGDGVAMRSTYGSLVDVAKEDERLYLGKINYIDFENDMYQWGDAQLVVMHKRRAFEHEREVRFVMSMPAGSANPLGQSVKVDIYRLIEELYVSPFCPAWYVNVVKSVVGKFAPRLADRVRWSAMKGDPLY